MLKKKKCNLINMSKVFFLKVRYFYFILTYMFRPDIRSVASGVKRMHEKQTVTPFWISLPFFYSLRSLPWGLTVSQANRLRLELSYLWIMDKGNNWFIILVHQLPEAAMDTCQSIGSVMDKHSRSKPAK